MSLVGSAVAFVDGKDCSDHPFCFRVVGATGNLVLQAASKEEQLEWAGALYHAIAVANGGRFLLDRERQGLFSGDAYSSASTALTVGRKSVFNAAGKTRGTKSARAEGEI